MWHMSVLSGLVSVSEVYWQFVLMMFQVEHQFPAFSFQLWSVTTLSFYISLLYCTLTFHLVVYHRLNFPWSLERTSDLHT